MQCGVGRVVLTVIVRVAVVLWQGMAGAWLAWWMGGCSELVLVGGVWVAQVRRWWCVWRCGWWV